MMRSVDARHRFGVFIVNLYYISLLVLGFQLLTLSRQINAGWEQSSYSPQGIQTPTIKLFFAFKRIFQKFDFCSGVCLVDVELFLLTIFYSIYGWQDVIFSCLRNLIIKLQINLCSNGIPPSKSAQCTAHLELHVK